MLKEQFREYYHAIAPKGDVRQAWKSYSGSSFEESFFQKFMGRFGIYLPKSHSNEEFSRISYYIYANSLSYVNTSFVRLSSRTRDLLEYIC